MRDHIMLDEAFDNGGDLPSGLAQVTNHSDKAEPILNQEQWAAFGRGQVYIAPPNTCPADFEAWRHLGIIIGPAREELIWRLNERLQGRDPGKPVSWRGLR